MVAAGGDSRKVRAIKGTAVVRGDLSRKVWSAAQQILRREMSGELIDLSARHTPPRHPEEPRPCVASRRIATHTRACGHPSRLAVKNGEHLRMTAERVERNSVLRLVDQRALL